MVPCFTQPRWSSAVSGAVKSTFFFLSPFPPSYGSVTGRSAESTRSKLYVAGASFHLPWLIHRPITFASTTQGVPPLIHSQWALAGLPSTCRPTCVNQGMPSRSRPHLPFPDCNCFRKADAEGFTTEQQRLRALTQQASEQLMQEHLRELKKRVSAILSELSIPVWRRQRFDGVHVPHEWRTEPNRYYWLEPKCSGGGCPFWAGEAVDCAQRPPPLGWSCWMYDRGQPPPSTSKFFRIEWDVREGEMLQFFQYWGQESLIQMIGAAEAIEESRTGNKRLTEAERAASPLQLCLRWDLDAMARTEEQERWKRPNCKALGELHFTGDGWEVLQPLRFTPADMMLLTKHEICVLSKRPKLKQFIFNDSCANGELSHWADTLHDCDIVTRLSPTPMKKHHPTQRRSIVGGICEKRSCQSFPILWILHSPKLCARRTRRCFPEQTRRQTRRTGGHQPSMLGQQLSIPAPPSP